MKRPLFFAIFAAVLLGAAPAFAQLDFGDAPDSYGTLLASGGARHTIDLNIRLGPQIDAEANGAPGALADGDNSAGVNDEDGVEFFSVPAQGVIPWQIGAWTQVRVKVSLGSAFTDAGLDGWVDFNHDGDFADPGERVFNNQRLADIGNKNDGLGHTLSVFVPVSALSGATYARFRLSSAGGLPSDGAAPDGEVEDYAITIVQPSLASGVNAHVRDGQAWITWNFAAAQPAQVYEIYKSTATFTDVANAQLVARLFPQEYAGTNLTQELKTAFDTAGNDHFVIPDAATGAQQQLSPGQGLCVETIRAGSASWFYAVVPRGRTTVSPNEISGAVAIPPFPTLTPPKMHVQQSGYIKDDGSAGNATTGYQVIFLNMWCDGDDTAGAGLGAAFPLMANSARRGVPHHCILMLPKGGLPAGGARPLNFVCHGGTAPATIWLPGRTAFQNVGVAPTKGCVVALEDRVFQMLNGVPDGQNTNWLGYVPTFNPFDNVAAYEGISGGLAPQFPPPANSLIMPYTLAFENWLLGELLADATLNIDPARVSILGHSGGGKGGMMWARTKPDLFSHVSVFDPEMPYNFDFGAKVRMFGITTTPPPGAGPTMVAGDNFPVAGLTDSGGGAVHFDDLLDLRTDVSAQRDLPPMRFYYGLREDNWVLDHDHTLKPDVQEMIEHADTNGTGAMLYWDMRDHGIEKWTLSSQYTAWGFVADDFWVPAAATQTKRDDPDIAARYRSDQSYPAFYQVRSRPYHDSPGIVDYGVVPPYFDNLSAYADPSPGDHFPATTTGYARRGTWGGYFDWINEAPPADARAPRDEAGQWASTVFLPTTTDGGGNTLAAVDAAPVAWLDCDIAVRRPQLFTPPIGTQVTWMECDQTSRLVWRSGVAPVGADGVVRLPGIAVPRAPLGARVVAATQLDFGDAPAAYPVTLAENGARHATDAALVLGTQRNTETDGTHHASANAAGENDNGVTGPGQLQKETVVTLQIQVSAACRLDAWVDWGADGRWEGNAADAYDRIATSLPLAARMNSLAIFVPASAAEGATFARFRVSFGGGLGVTGPAPDGEVEDYALLITAATVPTVPVLTFAQIPPISGHNITWEGNPAYSSQIEHSTDLVTWKTFNLPQPETAGINIADMPPEFRDDPKHFFRLIRRAMVTTPIPLPAPTTDGQPHSFTDQSFVHGGLARRYRLHLPHNWTPLRRWPLAILCPGHSQSAEEFWEKRSRMRLGLGNGKDANGNPDGDPNDGWILCIPEATSADDSYQWLPYENPATYTPPVTMPWIDDYGFVKALTDSLIGSGLNIDPARVYAGGFSNGGSMCHYMAARPGHPFAAFAMIESGIQFLTFHPDPLTGFAVPQRIGAPLPRPVLMNTQVNSLGWPYEGRPIGDMNYQGGAPSPGVMANVARWTVANGFGGTADDANHLYAAPPFTTKVTPPWVTTNGQNLRTSYDDARPDQGWPAALLTQPAWQAAPALTALFPYAVMPPVPLAVSQEYLHTIVPDPGASTTRVITTSGTWTVQRWRSAAGNPANEVVLVTISDGGHNWPSADSPWDANAEVLKFFQAH